MEESPYFFSSPEDDDSDDEDEENDTTSKKRRRSAEIILKRQEDNEKKQKASLDIGRSLFERAKEKDQKPDDEKDEHPMDTVIEDIKEEVKATTEEDSESETSSSSETINLTELSDEEVVYVNQTIANDHLEHPVTEGEPERTVTDFLELVVDGTDPEDAYETTVAENELSDEPENVKEREATEPQDEARVVNTPVERIVYTPKVISNESQRNTASVSQLSKEKPKGSEHIVKAAPISEEIVKRVVKRQTDKQEHKRLKARQKQVERQVQQMEESLSSQEQTLQRLTKENRVRMRQIEPAERTESSKVESRLNLTKPERLEQIGKVVISGDKPLRPPVEVKEKVVVKEKQTIKEKTIRPNNLRQYFRPEEVKTMRREDLMIVSEKIVVEGANLKDMYDNNLFSERALRRLVSEYLKGKDIRPLLRKEIVEKEMDYERDPVLRDRDHAEEIEHKKSSSLFDKMLSTIELPAVSNSTTERKTIQKDKQSNGSLSSDKKQVVQAPTKPLLINGILLFLIIILILLSIYLLLRKF